LGDDQGIIAQDKDNAEYMKKWGFNVSNFRTEHLNESSDR